MDEISIEHTVVVLLELRQLKNREEELFLLWDQQLIINSNHQL
jgi:hypothetical protein